MRSATSYDDAKRVVAQIEALQGPLPASNPWRHVGKPGRHTIRADTAQRLGVTVGVLGRAWQQVRAGEVFPRLRTPDCTQQHTLRIMALVRRLPEAEQVEAVEGLAQVIAQLQALASRIAAVETDATPMLPVLTLAESQTQQRSRA